MKKQGSRDEDFYSNLAATAEDDLSDISDADVNQMAKSLADLEDMDADLFGGKFKKKGSVKGERSSKPNTPRRTGTPRSRSTTPRASSPQTRVTSPTARVTSPIARVTSPAGRGTGSPTPEASLTPRGGSLKKSGMGTTSIPEHKPGTAPGKMTDIGSASSALKPGGAPPQERPGTVPKAKQKYDYADMDMDDLLAGFSDEDDDSTAGKAKASSKAQKGDTTVKNQRSLEETPQQPAELEESKRRNLFDRPPTRSGGNTEVEEPPRAASAVQPKKKEEPGIFSDDDDFLGGLGIEETGPSAPKAKSTEEEDKPARSVMDKLLAKDSAVSKHLETKKERREFVLDKKYTQPNNEEEEEDFQFGGYQPSVVSTSSRPTSRRSVRFQDEDDIFGFDRPPSRGRSPASSLSKKPDDMDWLNDIATAVKSAPSVSSTPPKQETKPATQTDTKPTSVKTDSKPQADSKPLESKAQDKEPEIKPAKSTPKPKSAADWLGLNDADDEDDEPASWMRTKSQQKTTPPSSAGDKRKEWLSSYKSEEPTEPKTDQKTTPKTEPRGSPADWLGLSSSKEEDDYLGAGLDPNSLLKSRLESPAFGGNTLRTDDRDLFKPPPKDTGPMSMPQQSLNRKPQISDSSEKHLTQQRPHYGGETEELMGLPLTGNQTERFDPPREEKKTALVTDLFNANRADDQRQDMLSTQADILRQQQQQQESLLAQQAQVEEMIRKQYQQAAKFQIPPPPVFSPEARTSVMANPPRSLIDAQTRLYKMEIERDYAYSLLEMNKRRFEEERQTIENSYKSRLELIEDTHKNKETRLREENEMLMNQYLSKVRQLESDKSEQSSQFQRHVEEFQRDKDQEIDRLKSIHKRTMEDLKREHEEDLERLKKAKDQQIEAAITSHETTKSLVQAVSMIQNNARDLGELQKKVDSWHNMGLDEREIAICSKDEQLRILQERLNRQQEENDLERKRLEDLIGRLETQLREQTRILDEERWKVKQEQTRLQSLQTSLEEERRLWTEQQARERSNIEKTRETLLEEQKSVLSQLHKERQSVAEERTKLNVALTVQREDAEDAAVKLAQAKAEFEALMKAISEEKNKQNIRRQELQREEDRLDNERRKLEMEQAKMSEKEEDLIRAAQTLKERSEEVDQMYMESQSKQEEGRSALIEAKKIESEESERAASIQHQVQLLRLKEREIADDRLRLSKEKKEVENLKSAMLCPNCRTPGGAGIKPQGGEQMMIPQNSNAPTYQVYRSPAMQQSNQAMQQSNPAMQQSLNSVGSITESIKADRSIRMWKMEALKDQKYLEEQSMFLYTLKHMPYSGSNSKS
ncbi:fas-binding factor 1 homolog isoform X1 [Saccostrea echinata]|uniref:fas-binding factor 1 homolog isoform X1 n=1 Tax=Saccostrea echinata TaxID=191078 RepID=UPI002A7EF880|nr:fas-binding factor 1 homolog isoform X1 [Saccostrea echinata]